MRRVTPVLIPCIIVAVGTARLIGGAQPTAVEDPAGLNQTVPSFELSDATVVEGLSLLSRDRNVALHLGAEEILRDRISDRQDRRVRFSLRLERATVREIVGALCTSDARYAWGVDGATINVYPVSRVSDPADLLNLTIATISFAKIPDPDQALTPLAALFPHEQIGYFHLGPANSYAEPWTDAFENLTVRQFVNRISEHMGPASSWIWQGGRDSRMFSFIKGGFH